MLRLNKDLDRRADAQSAKRWSFWKVLGIFPGRLAHQAYTIVTNRNGGEKSVNIMNRICMLPPSRDSYPGNNPGSPDSCLNMSSNIKEVTKKRKGAGDVYKLHLVLDGASFAKLEWLKGALKAASYDEVVRRALLAHKLFEPDDVKPTTGGARPEPAGNNKLANVSKSQNVEHIYIRAPAWMRNVLDEEKTRMGNTYAETVRQSLRVLFQLVREREALIAQIEKGDNNEPTSCGDGPNGLKCVRPILSVLF